MNAVRVACQMPIQVLNRIIIASSNPGDIVLDPFNGSGTSIVSAALLGRRYVGIEQSPEYVGYAQKRLQHTLEQAASTAPLLVEAGATYSDSLFLPVDAAVKAAADPNRASRVLTSTDAFGRPRVARGRRAKSA